MKKVKAILLSIISAALAGCESVSDRTELWVVVSSSDTENSGFEESLESVGSQSSSSLPQDPQVPQNTQPEYVDWMLEEKVHEIKIEMSEKDWQLIKGYPFKGDYHPAEVSIDGVPVGNVGVRTRGHASLYETVEEGLERYPLKIKFDKYEDNQNFMGLDELALNNGGDDYSFMRDYMGYLVFRLIDGYSSCVSFFNVYLNDRLLGFYVGVEAIDSSYLDRYFNSHRHSLYEGETNASLMPDMPLSCLTQKKGADTSKSDVKRLIKALDEMPLGEKGEIEDILDVDSALKMLAVNAVIDNRDGYGGIFAHNYYMYSDGGKLYMLPWDMNAPSVSPTTDIASPTVGVYDYSVMNTRPLAKKLLAVEEYYAVYLDYCVQLNELLPAVKQTVLRVYEMIKPHVENDPNTFCSTYTFNRQYSENYSYGIISFLTNRHAYLDNRLKELIGNPIPQYALNP